MSGEIINDDITPTDPPPKEKPTHTQQDTTKVLLIVGGIIAFIMLIALSQFPF